MAQIGNLRTMRREARAKAPDVALRPVRRTQIFGEDWAEADDRGGAAGRP